MRSRRVVLQTLAALGLIGCEYSPTLDLVSKTVGGGANTSRYPLDAAQIRAIPYATIGVRMGAASVIMALATCDGEDLHWISSDHAVLVTRHGRLVKTVGLPRDLSSTRFTQPDPLLLPGFGAGDGARIYRTVDLRPEDDFGVAVESRFEVIGPQAISILGREFNTIQVRERLYVAQWNWSGENLFWIDRDKGLVRRARQQFCPDIATIEYEVLKPAASAA